jgi:hypothetical protein
VHYENVVVVCGVGGSRPLACLLNLDDALPLSVLQEDHDGGQEQDGNHQRALKYVQHALQAPESRVCCFSWGEGAAGSRACLLLLVLVLFGFFFFFF